VVRFPEELFVQGGHVVVHPVSPPLQQHTIPHPGLESHRARVELSEQTHFQALRKSSLSLFTAYQFLRIPPLGFRWSWGGRKRREETDPRVDPRGWKMTPTSIPAQLPENHLRGPPCGSLEQRSFLSALFASDHLPQLEGGKTDHL